MTDSLELKLESIQLFLEDLQNFIETTDELKNFLKAFTLFKNLFDRSIIEPRKYSIIKSIISSVYEFINEHDEKIMNNEIEKIDEDVIICYKTSIEISVPIGKIIKNADTESLEAIRGHFLVIKNSLFEDDEETKNALISYKSKQEENNETEEDNSKEGKYVGNLLEKISKLIENFKAKKTLKEDMNLNNIKEIIVDIIQDDNLDFNQLMPKDLDINNLDLKKLTSSFMRNLPK